MNASGSRNDKETSARHVGSHKHVPLLSNLPARQTKARDEALEGLGDLLWHLLRAGDHELVPRLLAVFEGLWTLPQGLVRARAVESMRVLVRCDFKDRRLRGLKHWRSCRLRPREAELLALFARCVVKAYMQLERMDFVGLRHVFSTFARALFHKALQRAADFDLAANDAQLLLEDITLHHEAIFGCKILTAGDLQGIAPSKVDTGLLRLQSTPSWCIAASMPPPSSRGPAKSPTPGWQGAEVESPASFSNGAAWSLHPATSAWDTPRKEFYGDKLMSTLRKRSREHAAFEPSGPQRKRQATTHEPASRWEADCGLGTEDWQSCGSYADPEDTGDWPGVEIATAALLAGDGNECSKAGVATPAAECNDEAPLDCVVSHAGPVDGSSPVSSQQEHESAPSPILGSDGGWCDSADALDIMEAGLLSRFKCYPANPMETSLLDRADHSESGLALPAADCKGIVTWATPPEAVTFKPMEASLLDRDKCCEAGVAIPAGECNGEEHANPSEGAMQAPHYSPGRVSEGDLLDGSAYATPAGTITPAPSACASDSIPLTCYSLKHSSPAPSIADSQKSEAAPLHLQTPKEEDNGSGDLQQLEKRRSSLAGPPSDEQSQQAVAQTTAEHDGVGEPVERPAFPPQPEGVVSPLACPSLEHSSPAPSIAAMQASEAAPQRLQSSKGEDHGSGELQQLEQRCSSLAGPPFEEQPGAERRGAGEPAKPPATPPQPEKAIRLRACIQSQRGSCSAWSSGAMATIAALSLEAGSLQSRVALGMGAFTTLHKVQTALRQEVTSEQFKGGLSKASVKAPTQARKKLRVVHFDQLDPMKMVTRSQTIWAAGAGLSVPLDCLELGVTFEVPEKKAPARQGRAIQCLNISEDGKRLHDLNLRRRSLQTKMTDTEIGAAVLALDKDRLTAEVLENLIVLAPTRDERNDMNDYLQGKHPRHPGKSDAAELGEGEKFQASVVDMPLFEGRCQALLFSIEFAEDLRKEEDNFAKLSQLCAELRSRELLVLVHSYLAAGNFMNAASSKAASTSFALSQLTKLTLIRGEDSQKKPTNLLKVLMGQLARTHPTILNLGQRLKDVSWFHSHFQFGDALDNLNRIKDAYVKMRTQVKAAEAAGGADNLSFVNQMQGTLSEAAAALQTTQALYQRAWDDNRDTFQYFGETFDDKKPLDHMEVLKDFVEKFNQIVTDRDFQKGLKSPAKDKSLVLP
ncbi:hypothetical protein WJX73_001424 [Symbiochloris irregularis]|uniref:Formin-like protein n=1 Tax=Symbiochloris irregularis TaxID=706552 RepID=A0AAW1PIB2_9CHLO